jgi:MFS family permease
MTASSDNPLTLTTSKRGDPSCPLMAASSSPSASASPSSAASASASAEAERVALRRAERKLSPVVVFGAFLTIFINYIDRTNLSFGESREALFAWRRACRPSRAVLTKTKPNKTTPPLPPKKKKTNTTASVGGMSEAIGLSSTVYGLGSGLFFISYALCQLPSNIALDYFGGPSWMAATVALWGTVAALFAAVKTSAGFLALRFLLGIFEASAFPGMLLYISLFYPKDRTQMPMTGIIAGILLSQCAGAALATGLLSLDGRGGLAGWQWLFLIEGLACILVSAYWLFVMPRSIQHCRYLTQEERDILDAEMAKQKMGERQHARGTYGVQIKHALSNPITLTAGLFYFFYFLSYYGLLYFARECDLQCDLCFAVGSWVGFCDAAPRRVCARERKTKKSFRDAAPRPTTLLPSSFPPPPPPQQKKKQTALIIQAVLGRPTVSNGRPDIVAVALTAVPFAAAAIWQVAFSFHSQRRKEKRWHVVASWLAAAVFMLAMPAAMTASPAAGMVVLVGATMGIYGAFSVSSSYVMELLGAERAVGGAIMNSIGNLGGFVVRKRERERRKRHVPRGLFFFFFRAPSPPLTLATRSKKISHPSPPPPPPKKKKKNRARTSSARSRTRRGRTTRRCT